MQGVLFHDSIEDAIGSCIIALGGHGKVGGWLYPSLGSRAEARVRSNLNPERDHKFSPEEVELIGRKARDIGCYALQEYLALKWNCEFTPLEPAEAKKRIKKQRVSALIAELGRLIEVE